MQTTLSLPRISSCLSLASRSFCCSAFSNIWMRPCLEIQAFNDVQCQWKTTCKLLRAVEHQDLFLLLKCNFLLCNTFQSFHAFFPRPVHCLEPRSSLARLADRGAPSLKAMKSMDRQICCRTYCDCWGGHCCLNISILSPARSSACRHIALALLNQWCHLMRAVNFVYNLDRINLSFL